MPKPPRIVIPEVPHHVTQRGNNHQPIFLENEDRAVYLSILKEYCTLYGLHVFGYCLMTNHVHLVVTPPTQRSLSSGIGYSHRLYAQKINKKYDRSGHLWESRYYSCPLDDSHFIQALIYTDRNPVRAGIVDSAIQYRWSSAKAHSGLRDSAGLVDPDSWTKISAAYDWEELMSKEENENELTELRYYTDTGKSFVRFRK